MEDKDPKIIDGREIANFLHKISNEFMNKEFNKEDMTDIEFNDTTYIHKNRPQIYLFRTTFDITDKGQNSYIKQIKNKASDLGIIAVDFSINVGYMDNDEEIFNVIKERIEKILESGASIMILEPFNVKEDKEESKRWNNKYLQAIKDLIPVTRDLDSKSSKNRSSVYSSKEGHDQKFLDSLSNFNHGDIISLKNYPIFYVPSTAFAVLLMLDYLDVDVSGRVVSILGRSENVGKPLSMMLQSDNATVININSYTNDNDKKRLLKASDIIITATGKYEVFSNDDIEQDTLIIDVGTNIHKGSLVGDLKTKDFIENAYMINEVPGGVGPVTTEVLLMKAILSKIIDKSETVSS